MAHGLNSTQGLFVFDPGAKNDFYLFMWLKIECVVTCEN